MKSKHYDKDDSHSIYRDFSQQPDEDVLSSLNISLRQKPVTETFPIKLHKILERSDIDGYSDVVSWLPHGRAFKIHNAKAFVSQVMPHYFYISKITSFVRQLSIYGFRKVSRKGIDKGAYYHELFLSGRPGLCAGIIRLAKSKPTLKSKVEPNFYQMPHICRFVTIEDIKRGYIDENAPKKPRVIQYHISNSSTDTAKVDQNIPDTQLPDQCMSHSGQNESVPIEDDLDKDMLEFMNSFPNDLEEQPDYLETEDILSTFIPSYFDAKDIGSYCTNNKKINISNVNNSGAISVEARGNFCYSLAA